MSTEIKIEFCITGKEMLPDEITRILKIQPTKTWLMDDYIQNTQLKRKHNGWCLSIECNEEDEDIGKIASRLLEILLPQSNIINRICSERSMKCELSSAIYIVDEVPAINFDPKTIEALSSLHASIDIDVILLSE